jgi:hypothetical protein
MIAPWPSRWPLTTQNKGMPKASDRLSSQRWRFGQFHVILVAQKTTLGEVT